MFEALRPGVPASAVAQAGNRETARIRDRVHFHDLFAYSVGIGFPPIWIKGGDFAIVRENHRPI